MLIKLGVQMMDVISIRREIVSLQGNSGNVLQNSIRKEEEKAFQLGGVGNENTKLGKCLVVNK